MYTVVVDVDEERALLSSFGARYRLSSTAGLADVDLGGASWCCEDASCAHTASPEEPRAEEHKLELADIFARYEPQLGRLSQHQRRTVRAIVGCRTIRMGRHRRVCETCKYSVDAFNSCRNRHCPKCQRVDEVRWLDRQMRDVLPVPYHHVVFTVPHELHAYFRIAPKKAGSSGFRVGRAKG